MSQEKIAVTVIVTVLNEATTLPALLDALNAQSYPPTEIIIADGGSDDASLDILRESSVTLLQAPGNRSLGRNAAIAAAQTELLAITDAGCVPDEQWLAALVKCYLETHSPVIAGYYSGDPHSAFEKAVVPYALVMPDRVDPQSFLPATRSMLIKKSVWQELGGFDESLSDNEDFAFAQKIRSAGIPITFCQHAVVRWRPRGTVRQFWKMIFRFARGDIQAGIIRGKVVFLFARYLCVLLVSLLLIRNSVALSMITVTSLLFVYCMWAVLKNKRYVGSAWYWLPVLQLVSDIAVLVGSTAGVVRRLGTYQRTQ